MIEHKTALEVQRQWVTKDNEAFARLSENEDGRAFLCRLIAECGVFERNLESDAARILSLMESRQETPRPKFNFERGDDVRVIEGPFEGFNGVVDDVNYEKGKLRVSVSIFGRQTPVELDFVQVSKG